MYEKRLIATAVSIFAVGVAVGIKLNHCSTFAVCAVFAILAVSSVVLLAFFLKSKGNIVSKRITAAAFAVAALSFGGLRVSVSDIFAMGLNDYDNREDVASIEIDEVNAKYLDGNVISSEIGVPQYTKVRLYTTYYNDELSIGDVLTCELKYSFDRSNNLKSDGIYLTSSVDAVKIEKGKGLLYSIRDNINQNNDKLFGRFDYAAEISKGVTIGDRSEMNSYVFALYRNSGTSHLLAISGLHVSIIVLSFYNLLISLSVNRKISNCIAIIIAFLFAAITGFSVGATRSAIMIIIVMIFGLFLRKSDSITSLFIALMLFLFINPYSVCSVGLQLSFLCTFGILLVSPLLESVNLKLSLRYVKLKRFKRLIYKLALFVVMPLLTSLVASVFSFPVSFFNFSTTSSLAPFINIIIIPVFSLAVKLAVVSYLIAPISIGSAALFSYPAGFLFDFTTEFSKFIFNSNLGVISSRTPIMIIPLICAVVGIIMIMTINRKRNLVALLSFALFSVSIFVCGILNGSYTKDLYVIEYGNNNSEYVFCSAENKNMYLDLGGYSVNPEVIFENGSVTLENYFVSKYNYLTYEHVDYMTTEIKVKNLFLPLPRNANDMNWLNKIKLLANERDCDIIHYDDCCTLKVSDDFETEILPGFDDPSRIETIYISLGNNSIQILGDGFSNVAVCDYAIILDNCKTGVEDIDSSRIYAQSGYYEIDKYNNFGVSGFDDKLKFEVYLEEGDFRIYEP